MIIMAKGINPARMRYRLEFGKYEPSDNINPNTGESIDEFTPKFKRWAGQWTLTQTQQIALAGANIKDAIVFFIRHDKSVTSDYSIRKGDNIYTIDSITYDDGLSADGFDLITCHLEISNHA